MSNINIFTFANTCDDKLVTVKYSIKKIKNINSTNHYIFKNHTKHMLREKLKSIEQFIPTDTAILFFCGHGGYDNNRNMEIFYTNDNKFLYIHEIMSYFYKFKTIIIFNDTCQYLKDDYHNKKIELPQTSKIILCNSVPTGQLAYGTRNWGLFTKTICEGFYSNIKGGCININEILNIILKAYSNYYSKYKLVPKIYAHNLTQLNFNAFKKITRQKHFLITNRDCHIESMTEKQSGIIKLNIAVIEYNDTEAKEKLKSIRFYDQNY